jgi:hypothetical protein
MDIVLPDRETRVSRSVPQACADLLSLDQMSSASWSVLELVQTLPDLYRILRDSGIGSSLCRGSESIAIVQRDERQDDGTWTTKTTDSTFSYALDGITHQQRDQLVPFLQTRNSDLKVVSDIGANMVLRETHTNSRSPYHPDIVQDIHGKLYFIVDPANYLPEIGSMLAILFCFSMLARYYPDVWMARIDGEARTREFIDYVLNICYRKYPNLALDQLTTTKHHVHR